MRRPRSPAQWRPWALNHRNGVTFGESREYVTGLFECVLRGAGTDQGRWAALLSSIRDVPEKPFEQLFGRVSRRTHPLTGNTNGAKPLRVA
jgi:hypothetical protein